MYISKVDCKWEDWGDPFYPLPGEQWSLCTRECRKGTKVQTRKIDSLERHGGRPCNETGNATNSFQCNEMLCPEEIVYQKCKELAVRNQHRITKN